MHNKFWSMKQVNNLTVDIYIYGEITSEKWEDADTTASSFKQDLDSLGKPNEIHLHVNSPGGSVFEGIAIGNMLKSSSATVVAHVDALAASIASVIVANADKVIMPENAMLMIHNPFQLAMGNAQELRKVADDLDSITQSSVITYLAKGGEKLTEEHIKQIMDNETWLSAQEAFDIGLCDEIETSSKAVAKVDSSAILNTYQHVPTSIANLSTVSNIDLEQLIKETAFDQHVMDTKHVIDKTSTFIQDM